MDIIVSQDTFAKALSMVGRVASSRTGLAILNNVLLRTEGRSLVISATNLEIATTHRLNIKVTKEGSITIPAKLISDLVSSLPKEPLHLTTKNNTLFIKTVRHSSSVRGVGDDEFPELPIVDTNKSVSYSLSVNDFKHAATQTVICASSDSTRPVLTGIYWHTHDKQLFFAATDGYRLAERKIMSVETDVAAIIPASTIQEVLRSLTDSIESIEVSFDDTQVTFIFGDSTITSKLIDGNFPDYRQLIPEKNETTFETKRTELQQNTKLTSLFSRDNGGTISVEVDIDNQKVSIFSIGSETGENNSEINTSLMSGESGKITFNSRYLLDALSVVDEEDIKISFSGKLAPILLTPTTQSEYVHIIMPIKS